MRVSQELCHFSTLLQGDEDAIGDSLTKQDKQVVCVGLQPVHIREAFRRQNMTIGPLVPFAVSVVDGCPVYELCLMCCLGTWGRAWF